MKTEEMTPRERLIAYVTKYIDGIQASHIINVLVAQAEEMLKNQEKIREAYEHSIISPGYVIWQQEELLKRLKQD